MSSKTSVDRPKEQRKGPVIVSSNAGRRSSGTATPNRPSHTNASNSLPQFQNGFQTKAPVDTELDQPLNKPLSHSDLFQHNRHLQAPMYINPNQPVVNFPPEIHQVRQVPHFRQFSQIQHDSHSQPQQFHQVQYNPQLQRPHQIPEPCHASTDEDGS